MIRFGRARIVTRAVALALAGGWSSLASQEPDTLPAGDTTVYRLAPLEARVTRGPVPLERVPHAVSTLEGWQFRTARPQIDLHEALRRVPGVAVDNRHNLALGTRISIRGFGARSAFGVRGIRLLVDGIPLTLPDGQTALTNVDLGSADRIEVLRGPAAVLYGNAAGGVVSVTTMDPPREGLAEARLGVGSYGSGNLDNLVRLQANLGDRWARGSWFVGVSHLDLDGYREHSRARRTGVNARFRHTPDSRSWLGVAVNVATVPRAENPGSLPADSAEADPRMAWPVNVATRSGEEAAQGQAGILYGRQIGAIEAEVTGYGQLRALENPLPFGRYIRLRRAAGGGRLAVRSVPAASVGWTAGLELQAQRDRRLERDNLDGEIGGVTHRSQIDRVTAVAPFVSAQVPVGSGVDLRAGARYDRVAFDTEDRLDTGTGDQSGARTLDAWSGSAGLVLNVSESVRGWASLSSWFQTPTTTELINAPPAPGEPCCPGGFNPELEPEEGAGVEAGVRSSGAVAWEVVGYLFRARNLVLPFQVEGIEGREFYRNAGRTRHAGVEASLRARLPVGLSAGLAYAWTDLRFGGRAFDDVEGKRVPGVAPHRLNAHLDRVTGPLHAALELEWVSRYPVNDANSAHNAAYVVADARVARRVELGGAALEPFLEISNLLDRAYNSSVVINAFGGRYYEPAPGRAWLLGLRASFR